LRKRSAPNIADTFCGRWTARVDVEAQEDNSPGGSGDPFESDDAPLPLAYGSETLELMVRDPTWAHVYWDISIDRFNEAVGRGSRGRAFLRLIGAHTGHVLVEHAVWAERGSDDFALPEPDSSYVVELAVIRDYRWVVVARSSVVKAPAQTPRAAAPLTFVSRARQLRAVAEGLTLAPAGEAGQFGFPRVSQSPGQTQTAGATGQLGRPRVSESPRETRTAVLRGPAAAPASMGSEARLLRVDVGVRSAGRGSEARLVRRQAVHAPFVIARSPGLPGAVDAALSSLAAAVWSGRDPVHILGAGNGLLSALAEAGISSRPAVAILDPPGPSVPPPPASARDTSGPGGESCSVTESPDGSITVVGPDGSSITYSPVKSGIGDFSEAPASPVKPCRVSSTT
jgi:hypothetical protein